jgi:hypothetical protein
MRHRASVSLSSAYRTRPFVQSPPCFPPLFENLRVLINRGDDLLLDEVLHERADTESLGFTGPEAEKQIAKMKTRGAFFLGCAEELIVYSGQGCVWAYRRERYGRVALLVFHRVPSSLT